jgi:hypothetical protein
MKDTLQIKARTPMKIERWLSTMLFTLGFSVNF